MRTDIVLEQDEDGMWVAECPTLPGCIFQSENRQAALANIKDAIEGYRENLKKHDKSVRFMSNPEDKVIT